MKAKWGMIVTDGRGKIGGHVASKNKSGAYFRTKVTPVNPQTSYQNTVRNRLAGFSQSWRGLTQEQRDAWNAAVGAFQKTNIFGDLVSPSGFNLYQRLNNNLALTAQSAITTPPTPAAIDDIIIGELTITHSTPVCSLAFTPGSGGSVILLFATAPLSPGVSFVKSEYRLLSYFDSDEASPVTFEGSYEEKFGDLAAGSLGQKVFIKTVAINSTTGQAGVPQSTYALIGAPA